MISLTRFAPSPTGRLHLGHAFSALCAHDFARSRGGGFLLRIEDIDEDRVRPEYIDGIIEDLMWLGLNWDDEILYQSDRLPLYAEALGRLKAEGLAYPCFCTRTAIAAEIASSVSAPQAESEPGPRPEPGLQSAAGGRIYPGTCRALDRAEAERRMVREQYCWRIDATRAALRTGPLHWRDDPGVMQVDPGALGDFVLARKDLATSYHLAVVVDDGLQGITDIVRGRDLIGSTHAHRLLQTLLDLPAPAYHHHALLAGADGQRLAKRRGAPTLVGFRDAGADPVELVAMLRAGKLPAGYSIAPD